MKYSNLTKLITLNASSVALTGLLFIFNLSSAIAADAPGTLSQEPLHTSATAPPNLMFLLDTSGSMRHVVPDESSTDSDKYNPATTYLASCASAGQKPKDRSDASPDDLYIRIISSKPKVAYARTSGTHYTLGNAAGMICFETAKYYNASLNADDGTSAAGGNTAIYLGNYLNWYFDFDNTTTNWSSGQELKPGTGFRMGITRDTMTELFDSLTNVRVGLAKLNGEVGAEILQSIEPISTGLSNLKTSVAALDQTGNTPVAEALHQLGRYFVGEDGTNNPGALAAGSTANTNGEYVGDFILHPNDTAVNISNDTLFDVSPAYASGESDESPIQYSCQSNFAIVMTDGVPSKDQGISSTTLLQDYDSDCVSASPACLSDDRKNTTDYSYGTDGGDYLDDVAQALFEVDLRPDIDTPSGDDSVNNVTTFTIAFADLDAINSNLLGDTASQGGGEALSATTASDLKAKFASATSSIIASSSTSSAVTFNSSTLSSQSAVYQALFNTVSWSGELNSFPIDGFTGEINTACVVGTNNCWNASTQLDGQTPSTRFIITYGDSNNGVDFAHNSSSGDDYTNLVSANDDLPQALIDDLCAGPNIPNACNASTTADSTKKAANGLYIDALVNYLRGDRSEEGSSSTYEFRSRISVLGDIVDASPVFIGQPQLSWPSTGFFPPYDAVPADDKSYTTWKASSVKDRTEVIYAAANDGMLHGFRAKETVVSGTGLGDAGEEIFAYVPTGFFSTDNTKGLHYLASTSYSHRYYADLTPTISDVFMDYKTTNGVPTGTYSLATAAKDTSTAEWRTVLLGGLRGGGKSLFLLDVTDPDNYVAGKEDELVLWEFSDSDNTELGYTFSKPLIAMMNNGKFAAIFGNGYNSTSCKAQLFVVFLEGGLDGVWTQNTDYFVYDTGTAHGGGAGDCNGLSTPAVVDLDGNGSADRVYAGDLKGNMWVFDLCAEVTNDAGDCSTTASNWGIAHADPLMNANVAGVGQPITTKPVVSLDPASSGGDDLIIVFGTGQYLTDADKATTGTQSMYGVRDYDALNNSAAGVPAEWNLDGDDNSPQRWARTVFAIDSGGTGARVFDSTDTLTANYHGWRIDLPDSGERMVVNPKIRNNIVFFNTLIPDSTKCAFGGSGWIMSVNLEDGGLPPEPVFDLDNSGTIGDDGDTTDDGIPAGEKLDEMPAESTFLGDNQYTPGSDGTINKRKVNTGDTRNEGRMSWKEVYEEQ